MRLFVLLAVVSLAGCATYIPHSPYTPPPEGTEIRVRLTDAGAVRATGLFGQPIREMEGRIQGLTPDSLYLALLSAQEYRLPWNQEQQFTLAKSELLALEEKRIDSKKTAILAVGAGTVTGFLIVALFKAATRTDNTEGGDADLAIIPIFSIIH